MKNKYIQLFGICLIILVLLNINIFKGLPNSNYIPGYTYTIIEICLYLFVFQKILQIYGNDNAFIYIIRYKNYKKWYYLILKKGIYYILGWNLTKIIYLLIFDIDKLYLLKVILDSFVAINLYIMYIYLFVNTKYKEIFNIMIILITNYTIGGMLGELHLNKYMFVVPYNVNMIQRYDSVAILIISIVILLLITTIIFFRTIDSLERINND